jgi:RNA polymerase sigma factor (sigma-70 family)
LQVLDWQVIIKEHGAIVWQTAYRLLGNHADTADCFQETFLAALQVSQRQSVRNFPALLVRLATSRAIDQLRQRFRRSRHRANMADQANLSSTNPRPEEQIQAQELGDRLRNAVGQLPPQESKAFCLRYLSDMSYREIAEELDINTSAAGVLLHRAKARLRESLQSWPERENEVTE